MRKNVCSCIKSLALGHYVHLFNSAYIFHPTINKSGKNIVLGSATILNYCPICGKKLPECKGKIK